MFFVALIVLFQILSYYELNCKYQSHKGRTVINILGLRIIQVENELILSQTLKTYFKL